VDKEQEQSEGLWPREQPNNQPQPARQGTGLFKGLRENKKYVIKSSLLIIIFWLAEFAYQYLFL